MTKFLFVDVDGVLNHPGCWGKRPWAKAIDPELVARLRALVEETGAKCVLSSTWRFAVGYDETLAAIAANGWPDVADHFVGETPVHHDLTRGDEIMAWLQENQDREHYSVTRFAVLDDCTQSDTPTKEFAMVKDNWVVVHGAFGLSDDDVERAKELLGT